MSFSVSMITTVADCDLLLSLATKEKSDLEFRKLSTERQRSSYAENAGEVEAELAAANAELTAVNTVLGTLPEGPTKDEHITKKMRLELKLRLLNERKENYGTVALLAKEFDQARLEKELLAAQEFTAAVQARKAAL
jgi:hypothetical protein